MVHKLFTPVTVGQVTVPHRVVLAPLTRCRATVDQVPKDIVGDYYTQRATCQGLLITEATSIHVDAAPFGCIPGIYREEQIKAWRRIVERVHATGGKIFMQLWHAGRTVHSSLLNGKPPVSSSAVKMKDPVSGKYIEAIGKFESDVPRALKEDEVQKIVEQYVTAAENAVIRAGFDGIEIHAANGYLVDQFLRDCVNKRTDSYGGTIEKRCKFALDIIEAISEIIGTSRVGIRFSPFGTFNSMEDSDPVALCSHLFRTMSRQFPELAYIHITEQSGLTSSVSNEDRIAQLRKLWTGPLILNINGASRDKAIQIIEEGKAEMVAIGRDFLANPDLPFRLFQNLPLNPQDYNSTFYTNEKEGYTDYPFYKHTDAQCNDCENDASKSIPCKAASSKCWRCYSML